MSRRRKGHGQSIHSVDLDEKPGTLTGTGKVIRVTGQGLLRVDETKSTAGRRTLPLPKFTTEIPQKRRRLPYFGEQEVIFPSTAGTLRDPSNFAKRWRTARDEPSLGNVTTHSCRKAVATLTDDEGLPTRVGADQLGHSHVSITQDRYMSRGRVHTQFSICSTGQLAFATLNSRVCILEANSLLSA